MVGMMVFKASPPKVVVTNEGYHLAITINIPANKTVK
jgi:hypothetical protein